MAKSTMNATKKTREYGIPNLCIHKIDLRTYQQGIVSSHTAYRGMGILTKLPSLLTRTIGAHIAITTPMLCVTAAADEY